MTIKDIIEEWIFEKNPRYYLTQNKYFPELWGVRQPNGQVVIRIDTEANTVHADGKVLSFHDPNFFDNLKQILRL